MSVNKLRSRAKALAGFGTDAALTSGFGFIVVLLAARSASVADFGQFALILAVVGAQVPLAAFGFMTLVYGRTATRPGGAGRLLGSATAITSLASVAIYVLTLLSFGRFGADTLALLYAGAGLRLLGTAGLILTQDAMARQSVGEYLPGRVLSFTLAVVSASLAVSAQAPLAVFALIWGAESLLFTMVTALTLGRKRARLSRRNRFRPYLAKAAPIAVQSVFIVIYLRFDQIYVGWRFGEASLGLYAAAARLAEIGNLGFNVLILVVTPMIIRQMRTSGRLDRRALMVFGWLAGLTLTAVGAASIISGDVLALSFGPAYAAAGGILTVYLGSIFFVAAGGVGSRLLAAQGVSGPQALSGVAGAVSNVVLSVVLGEVVGLEGVALATVISYALAAAILWHFVLRCRTGSKPKLT